MTRPDFTSDPEVQVLNELLWSPKESAVAFVLNTLREDDFYNPLHGQVFTAIKDTHARTYEMERERRHHQELTDSGQISNQQAVIDIINNDPYAGMSWEEKQAALDHDHEMSSKCPPLDYVESLEMD